MVSPSHALPIGTPEPAGGWAVVRLHRPPAGSPRMRGQFLLDFCSCDSAFCREQLAPPEQDSTPYTTLPGDVTRQSLVLEIDLSMAPFLLLRLGLLRPCCARDPEPGLLLQLCPPWVGLNTRWRLWSKTRGEVGGRLGQNVGAAARRKQPLGGAREQLGGSGALQKRPRPSSSCPRCRFNWSSSESPRVALRVKARGSRAVT